MAHALPEAVGSEAMTTRRLMAAICVLAIALAYSACNRIIDLTPGPNGPDASFVDDAGSDGMLSPDSLIINDAYDAVPFDGTPDAS
jgi:hypothetical protein